MTVSIDIDFTHSLEAGDIYRVNAAVNSVEDITASVFVFVTDTEAFSHVATPHDIVAVLDETLLDAQNNSAEFYRLDAVTRDFEDVDTAVEFSEYTRQRLDGLASNYSTVITAFVGTTNYVLTE